MKRKRSRKTVKEQKIRYGAELGAALQDYFDNPPYLPPAKQFGFRWTPKLLSVEVGVSERAVRLWLNGASLPALSMSTIISVIFGPEPEKFASEIKALWGLFRLCEKRRDERGASGGSVPENSSAVLTGDSPTAPANERPRPFAEAGARAGEVTGKPIHHDERLDRASFGPAAGPAPFSDVETYREQVNRLRIEQRANARQSAQLLAAEATRCNQEGNFDAGMRFALAGWLATAKENMECIPEIAEQLEQGARGIRLMFKEVGACLHAHFKDAAGDDLFILSKDKKLYAYDAATGRRIEIIEFDNWFAISEYGLNVVTEIGDDDIQVIPLASRLGVSQQVQWLWPVCGGGVLYQEEGDRQDHMDLSADGDILLRASNRRLNVWSIADKVDILRRGGARVAGRGRVNVLSSNGEFLVSDQLDEEAAMWGLRPFRKICNLGILCDTESNLSWASISENCKKIFLRFESSLIYVVLTDTLSMVNEVWLGRPIAHSLDGVFLAGCVDNQINVFDTSVSEYIYRESDSKFVNYGLEFSRNNQFLYVQKASTINILDINDNFRQIHKLYPGNEVHSFEVSDGNGIVLANTIIPDFEYQVYNVAACDTSSGRTVVHLSPAAAIAAAPDDSLIAGEKDKRVLIFDGTGSRLSGVSIGDHCYGLRFSRDGRFLFSFQRKIYTDVEAVGGWKNAYVFDVEFENRSLHQLVDFICRVKLKGREFFSKEDLSGSLYRSVPFDVVDQCIALLADIDFREPS